MPTLKDSVTNCLTFHWNNSVSIVAYTNLRNLYKIKISTLKGLSGRNTDNTTTAHLLLSKYDEFWKRNDSNEQN